MRGLRIAVCWSELPGYAAACVRALSEREGVEVLVVRYVHQGERPFDQTARRLPVTVHTVSAQQTVREQWWRLRALLEEFQPEAAVVSGWAIPAFNRAARWVRRRRGHVVCMSDRQWRGDLRQLVGSLYARLVFGRRYSAIFVPGERARPLAAACGYTGRRLITGCLSCDWALFSEGWSQKMAAYGDCWPRVFLLVGNVDRNKGISYILHAYSAYRAQVVHPWDLYVAGQGPLASLLENVRGVRALGFVQPRECARLMADAGALILGSYREQWGVAIHEATSAGLPVLCSRQCGASADLVVDGVNGFTYEAGEVDVLANLMVSMTSKAPDELREMGRTSFELSKQYTPELWADRLLRGLERLRLQDG